MKTQTCQLSEVGKETTVTFKISTMLSVDISKPEEVLAGMKKVYGEELASEILDVDKGRRGVCGYESDITTIKYSTEPKKVKALLDDSVTALASTLTYDLRSKAKILDDAVSWFCSTYFKAPLSEKKEAVNEIAKLVISEGLANEEVLLLLSAAKTSLHNGMPKFDSYKQLIDDSRSVLVNVYMQQGALFAGPIAEHSHLSEEYTGSILHLLAEQRLVYDSNKDLGWQQGGPAYWITGQIEGRIDCWHSEVGEGAHVAEMLISRKRDALKNALGGARDSVDKMPTYEVLRKLEQVKAITSEK